MTSTEVATQAGGSLVIRPGQTEWTPVQLAGLAQMGIQDASPEDQQLFLHHCTRTGLDPFAKQVDMIGRSGDVTRKDERGRTITERGTIYTIQTGIDGYRLIGERAARANGDVVEHEDPVWRGKPGTEYDHWVDYWPDGIGAPAACRYVITVNGTRKVGLINFHEFAQYSSKGELTPMWKKMPANQMAVRAEAQAWRKAYPADFSGMALGSPTDPAHHTVIDSDGEPASPPGRQERTTGRGMAGLEAAMGASDPGPKPEPAHVIDGQGDAAPAEGEISQWQYEKVVAGLDKLFKPGVEGRAEYVRAAVKAPVENLRQLTAEQADDLLLVIAEHVADENADTPDASTAADDSNFK